MPHTTDVTTPRRQNLKIRLKPDSTACVRVTSLLPSLFRFEADVEIRDAFGFLDAVRHAGRDEDQVTWLDGSLDATSDRAAAQLALSIALLRLHQRPAGCDNSGPLADHPDLGDLSVL